MLKILLPATVAALLLSLNLSSKAQEPITHPGAKPMVVAIYNENCRISCKLVKPLIKELSTKYGTRVSFHELDITKKNPKKSIAEARALGVESFVLASAAYIPCVGIFDSNKVLVKEIPAKKPKAVYIRYIEKALKDSG